MSDRDPSLVNAFAWRDAMEVQGWRQAGGSCDVPAALPPLNATEPRAFVQLLEWEAKHAISCELELQTQSQPAVTPTGFPDGSNTSGARAGAFQAAFSWNQTAGGNNDIILAKYETGSGADARVFYSDCRPGRFSLGVQRRVRISLARWLRAGAAGTSFSVQGSIGPAHATDADPLTYTAAIEVLAAGQAQIEAPPGAQWWNFDISNGLAPFDGSMLAVANESQYMKDCSPLNPVQWPPSSPWPFTCGPGFINFLNTGATNLNLVVTFWVR